MNRSLAHRSKNHFKPLLIIVALMLFAAIILILLEKTKTTDLIKLPLSTEQKQAQETAKNNEAQKKKDEEQKQQFLDDTAEKQIDSETSEATVQQSEPVITDMTAKQETNTVLILTKLTPVASGECQLKITNGTKTYEQQVRVIYQPEFSSCAGFSVAKSTLGNGLWKITLNTTSGDLSGTKTLDLEVK